MRRYVQGAAAPRDRIHADAGDGNDLNTERDANMSMGSDMTIAAFSSTKGDNEYKLTTLPRSSNCNGIGLFVDNVGNDSYTATSDKNSGMGNVSTECIMDRPNAVSIGIMQMQVADSYTYPMSMFDLPTNDLPGA